MDSSTRGPYLDPVFSDEKVPFPYYYYTSSPNPQTLKPQAPQPIWGLPKIGDPSIAPEPLTPEP